MTPLEAGAGPPVGFAGSPQQATLTVNMSLQEETNWCWSAVTQAVLRFLHAREVAQQDIATAHMHSTGKPYACDQPKRRKQTARRNCADQGCGGVCNDAHILRIILREQGCFHSILSAGAPTFAQIRSEIDAGRPLPCRVQWQNGGHFILVTGWMIGADGIERVRVLDPARNEGSAAVVERTMTYSAFATRYRGTAGTGRVNYSYRVA